VIIVVALERDNPRQIDVSKNSSKYWNIGKLLGFYRRTCCW